MAQRSKSGGLLILLVLGAVLLARKSKDAGIANMNLTGTKVEPQKSWSGQTSDWARTRFGAALAEVKKRWGADYDDKQARDVALSILTHWSIETAAGAAEWNYNVGNITAVGKQTYFLLRDISGDVLPFRAFDSITDGVAAYFDLLSTLRYQAAAKKLSNDPTEPDWYVQLGKSGWFDPTKAQPPSTWEHAAADYAARRANLAQYAAG